MYILLTEEETVQEIIPDIAPIFPSVPIQERYAPDFVAQLIHIPDDTPVEQGWTYDREKGTFTAPPEPEEIPQPPKEEPEEPIPGEPTTRALMDALLGVGENE